MSLERVWPKGKTVTLWVMALDFPEGLESKFVERGGPQGAEKHLRISRKYTWGQLVNRYLLANDELGRLEARLKTGGWVDVGSYDVLVPNPGPVRVSDG